MGALLLIVGLIVWQIFIKGKDEVELAEYKKYKSIIMLDGLGSFGLLEE